MKKIFTLALFIISIAAQSGAQTISSVKPSLSFLIYPNPAIDEIAIAVAPSEHSAVINIYNAVGDLIYSKTCSANELLSAVKINVSDFQRGMYVVQIMSDDNKISRKLLLK